MLFAFNIVYKIDLGVSNDGAPATPDSLGTNFLRNSDLIEEWLEGKHIDFG